MFTHSFKIEKYPPVPAVYPSIRWDLIASPRLSDHFLLRPLVAFGVRHASPVLVSVKESKKQIIY